MIGQIFQIDDYEFLYTSFYKGEDEEGSFFEYEFKMKLPSPICTGVKIDFYGYKRHLHTNFISYTVDTRNNIYRSCELQNIFNDFTIGSCLLEIKDIIEGVPVNKNKYLLILKEKNLLTQCKMHDKDKSKIEYMKSVRKELNDIYEEKKKLGI